MNQEIAIDWLGAWGQFFWFQFILGFCRHLPLLAVCLVMLLVIAGRIGSGLGIPLLIWHEHLWKRFFSGFALASLYLTVFSVAYLLEGDVRKTGAPGNVMQEAAHSYLDRRWVPPPPDFPRSKPLPAPPAANEMAAPVLFDLGSYYWYVVNLGILLLLAFLVVRLAGGPICPAMVRKRWGRLVFLGGGVLAVLLYFGVAALIEKIPLTAPGRWLQQEVVPLVLTWSPAAERPGKNFDQEWGLHLAAALFTGLLVASFFLYRLDRNGVYVSPVVSVCTILGLAVNAYGFVLFWLWFPLLPTLLALAVLIGLMLGGRSLYRIRFAHLPAEAYKQPRRLADYPLGGARLVRDRPTTNGDAAAETDLAAPSLRQDPPEKRPLVLLSVSGGASRAAVWVSLMLDLLNQRIEGFLHQVRLVTGASGGMVGAAYWVAALQRPADWPARPLSCRFADRSGDLCPGQMVRRLAGDALSPVIHQLCFYDLLSLFWPRSLAMDRGQGLEAGWSTLLNGVLDVPFRSLQKGEEEGWRPSLLFSPMLIEDGRRLLISNLELGFLITNQWRALDRSLDRPPLPYNESREEVEFFKLFPDASDFRLSTAARMSASFPYISPAAVLPTTPRRRVVDAGYYDNFGINLAGAWLRARLTWIRQHASRVVLVQIRDGLSEDARRSVADPEDQSTSLSRGMEWLASPPAAVLTARSSVMAYRNDEQLEYLSGLMAREFGDQFFTTVLLENSAPVSMSWYVADRERELMTQAALDPKGRVQTRIRALADWWNRDPGRNLNEELP